MDSISSANVTRNIGTTNIKKPVLIKKGGKIIFFAEVGFFEAFNLTKITNIAINAANMDETIIKHNHSFSHVTYKIL